MMDARNPTLSREDKAKLLEKHVVITVKNETAMCPSFTDPSKMYHVNIKEGNCDCPDNKYRQVNCMHMQAVDFRVLSDKIKAKPILKSPNQILSDIFDEIAIEDTQKLIRKDLLLDIDSENSLMEYQNKRIAKVCANDKSHTEKLLEEI